MTTVSTGGPWNYVYTTSGTSWNIGVGPAKGPIVPVYPCVVLGHEHESMEEAGACSRWIYDNWAELRMTGLKVRPDMRKKLDRDLGY